MRVHTFKVRKNNISVEHMSVLCPSVLNHCVRNNVLVVAYELTPASRTHLLVRHERIIPALSRCYESRS
jgi:hypothetical protein